jgi:lipopolysaccharide transport system permease protein
VLEEATQEVPHLQFSLISAQWPNSLFRLLASTTLWRHRALIWQLAVREIETKHKGSILGLLWNFIVPLVMVGVYYFVFLVVLKTRWGDNPETGEGQFALLLYIGVILFGLFSESIGRAPSIVLENVSYVKKVVFPLEILPCVILVVSLVGAMINFVGLAVFYPFVFGVPPVTALLLPFILLPFCLMILGVSWFVASVGVFLRDIRPMIGLLMTVTMFMSPVFYPIKMVPEQFRTLMVLSPLTTILEAVRDVLFWGRMPDFAALAIYSSISVMVAAIGYWWFLRTRKAFADVV